MRGCAAIALVLLLGCKDSTDVRTLAGSYKLVAANGLELPAEIGREQTAQRTYVTRVLDGALQFRSADSALFLIDAEAVEYDNGTGELVTVERSCSISVVGYQIAGDSLHLDYVPASPPLQGSSLIPIQDTLTISSRSLDGNHRFAWTIPSLSTHTIFLEFEAASTHMACPPAPADSSRSRRPE